MHILGAIQASTLPLLALSPPGWGATLLLGLWNSVQIAFGAFALGLTIGILGAYGKLYGSPVVKDLLAIYTTIVPVSYTHLDVYKRQLFDDRSKQSADRPRWQSPLAWRDHHQCADLHATRQNHRSKAWHNRA